MSAARVSFGQLCKEHVPPLQSTPFKLTSHLLTIVILTLAVCCNLSLDIRTKQVMWWSGL